MVGARFPGREPAGHGAGASREPALPATRPAASGEADAADG
jgi:hypothetical protein